MEEGSALIEIRPYQFGTKASVWANAFMPKVSADPWPWADPGGRLWEQQIVDSPCKDTREQSLQKSCIKCCA